MCGQDEHWGNECPLSRAFRTPFNHAKLTTEKLEDAPSVKDETLENTGNDRGGFGVEDARERSEPSCGRSPPRAGPKVLKEEHSNAPWRNIRVQGEYSNAPWRKTACQF